MSVPEMPAGLARAESLSAAAVEHVFHQAFQHGTKPFLIFLWQGIDRGVQIPQRIMREQTVAG